MAFRRKEAHKAQAECALNVEVVGALRASYHELSPLSGPCKDDESPITFERRL